MPNCRIVNLSAAALLALFFLSSCSNGDSRDKGVVARVNGEPIFLSETQREIALKVRQNPMFEVTPQVQKDEIDTLINKKIIIQEAIKKGLVQEPRFVNTIKNFWEQTLIRDFLDYKRREFQDYIFVTEDEIRKYYEAIPEKPGSGTFEELKPEIERRIANDKESKLFEDWLRSEREKAKIKILEK